MPRVFSNLLHFPVHSRVCGKILLKLNLQVCSWHHQSGRHRNNDEYRKKSESSAACCHDNTSSITSGLLKRTVEVAVDVYANCFLTWSESLLSCNHAAMLSTVSSLCTPCCHYLRSSPLQWSDAGRQGSNCNRRHWILGPKVWRFLLEWWCWNQNCGQRLGSWRRYPCYPDVSTMGVGPGRLHLLVAASENCNGLKLFGKVELMCIVTSLSLWLCHWKVRINAYYFALQNLHRRL